MPMSPSPTAPAIFCRKSASFSNRLFERVGIVLDPPRILIVDDNEHNRAILAARLGANGYATAEACDGVEALEMVRSEACNLIFARRVDAEDRTGLKACRQLEKRSKRRVRPNHSGHRPLRLEGCRRRPRSGRG